MGNSVGRALFLARVPVIVLGVALLALGDFALPGTVRESFRYSLVDRPEQLALVAVALGLACLALRKTTEATILLVSPALISAEHGQRFARALPRILPAIMAAITALPLIAEIQPLPVLAGLLFLLIGWAVAAPPGFARPRDEDSDHSIAHQIALILAIVAPIPIIWFLSGEFFITPIPGAGSVLGGVWESPLELALLGIWIWAACQAIRFAAMAAIAIVVGDNLPSRRVYRLAILLVPALLSLAAAAVLVWQMVPGQRLFVGVPVLIAVAATSGLRSALSGEYTRRVRDWRTGAVRLGRLLRGQAGYLVPMLVLAVAVVIVFCLPQGSRLAQLVGPVGVVLLWVFSAAMVFFPIAYAAHVVRIPLLAMLALFAVLISYLDLNDNHEIRRVRTAAPSPPTTSGAPDRPYFRQTFSLETWLRARAPYDLYQYEHYPVIIVATEGGGLRAAYFTSQILATLQDLCPAFAMHTIAISGVSGGSVGAAAFAALSAHERKVPGCDLERAALAGSAPMAAKTREIYRQDWLSPLLAATLFPDALQRVLPFRVAAFDRDLAIERSFEESLDAIICSPTCARGDAVICSPACDHGERPLLLGDLYAKNDLFVPDLFFGTTEVSTGTAMPFGTKAVMPPEFMAKDTNGVRPVCWSSVSVPPTLERNCRSAVQEDIHDFDDLPLSTAAFLSARFPFAMPAARVTAAERRHRRFVDGGYYENSGTWLVDDLLENIMFERRQAGKRQTTAGTDEAKFQKAMRDVNVVIVIIKSTPCTNFEIPGLDASAPNGAGDYWLPEEANMRRCKDYERDTDWDTFGLTEFASPIRALLNTRLSRTIDAIASLRRRANQYQESELGASPTGPRIFPNVLPSDVCFGAGSAMPQSDTGVRFPVSVVELNLYNTKRLEIPLTWVLSSVAKRQLDGAIDSIRVVFTKKVSSSDTATVSVSGPVKPLLCLLRPQTPAR